MDCKDKGRGYLWIYLHMLNEFLYEKKLKFFAMTQCVERTRIFLLGI